MRAILTQSNFLRSLTVDIGYSNNAGFRQTERQRFGMYVPDSPGADNSDMKLVRGHRWYRSFLRASSYRVRASRTLSISETSATATSHQDS